MSNDDKHELTGDRRQRERRSRKPSPLPVRDSSDIFASSEATHLIDGANDRKLPPSADEPTRLTKQFLESPEKTKIISLEQTEATPIQKKQAIHLSSSNTGSEDGAVAETTQMLDVIDTSGTESTRLVPTTSDEDADSTRNVISGAMDDAESTRNVQTGAKDDAIFQDNDEKTSFFHVGDRGVGKQIKPAPSGNKEQFVDPRPRQTENGGVRGGASASTPSPLPRKTQGQLPRSSRPAASSRIEDGQSHVKPKQPKPIQQKSVDRRSINKGSKTPGPRRPLNKGIFSTPAPQTSEDVIGQVIESSWGDLPDVTEGQGVSTQNGEKNDVNRTKTLWIRISLGFLVLIAVGFLFSSRKEVALNETKERAVVLVEPLETQLQAMSIALSSSEFARTLRPGADIFVIGKQKVILITEGEDRSARLHADSLYETIKNSPQVGPIIEQLAAITVWPEELALGIDQATKADRILLLSEAIENFGVKRLNLLVQNPNTKKIGDLRMSLAKQLDKLPSVGALGMKVDRGTISLSFLETQKTTPILSLEAFAPELDTKLDQQVESFAFEHPRTTKAIVTVPASLKLGQVVDLVKPLVRDERMSRVTILSSANGPQP